MAPPAVTSAAVEAIEFCESVGLTLDPWQQLVLQHTLGEQADHRWSAFEVGLCVPRQNGKSALAEARILAGLFVFGEETLVYSAHLFDTAMEVMRRLEEWLHNSGESFKTSRSNGKEGFELSTGQRVKFKTRTKGGGRGLSGDCVILDEAMILDATAIGALLPTLAAKSTNVPGPQLWYMGSAVDQEIHDKGYVFSSVRKRAQGCTSPRLCYLEWGCEDGADPTSLASRAQSNPGLGIRITPEYIEDEYQAMLHTPKIFAVERLGIGDWPTLDDALDKPLAGSWEPLADDEPTLAAPFPQTIGIDRDPQTRVWGIGAAQRTTRGGVHVEIGYSDTASVTDMAKRVIDLVTDADPIALVIDQHSPAAALKPYLIEAGIEPHMTNAPELALACEGIVEAALAGAAHLTHSGQKILDDSALSATTRELPGGRFAFDRPPGGSIVQLMGVTLAHWALLTFGSAPKSPPPPMADKVESSHVDESNTADEFDAMSAPF